MEEILWLLADRPDHAHLRVGDLVVAGVGRGQLLPDLLEFGVLCLQHEFLFREGGRELQEHHDGVDGVGAPLVVDVEVVFVLRQLRSSFRLAINKCHEMTRVVDEVV